MLRIGCTLAICCFVWGSGLPSIGAGFESTSQARATIIDKHFNCAFGNPFLEGRTVMLLQASGTAKVSFSRGEQSDVYESELSKAANEAIWQKLQEAAICSLKRNRPGVPEEQIIHFELFENGETCQGEAWSNDQNSNPALQALMNALTSMTKEISDGKISIH